MSEYLNSAKETLSRATSAIPTREGLAESANNLSANVQSSVQDVKNSLNGFSSKNVMNASSEFLNTNSLIAKFAFLILVLVAFVLILRVSVWLIAYFLSPSKQPYLVKGMIPGNIPATITQDPANSESPIIYRSNNQTGGIEFTYAVWLKLDSVGSDAKHRHIFNKGSTDWETTAGTTKGRAKTNNGPGLYFGVDSTSSYKETNSLVFLMDVENTSSATVPVSLEVSNIPMQKWFHVAYRVQNYSIDCYVNGVLTKSASFSDKIPKQNYYDVNVCQNNGFPGALSNLRYYDYALSPFDIAGIVGYGPNLTASKLGVQGNNSAYDYLSQSWYK